MADVRKTGLTEKNLSDQKAKYDHTTSFMGYPKSYGRKSFVLEFEARKEALGDTKFGKFIPASPVTLPDYPDTKLRPLDSTDKSPKGTNVLQDLEKDKKNDYFVVIVIFPGKPPKRLHLVRWRSNDDLRPSYEAKYECAGPTAAKDDKGPDVVDETKPYVSLQKIFTDLRSQRDSWEKLKNIMIEVAEFQEMHRSHHPDRVFVIDLSKPPKHRFQRAVTLNTRGVFVNIRGTVKRIRYKDDTECLEKDTDPPSYRVYQVYRSPNEPNVPSNDTSSTTSASTTSASTTTSGGGGRSRRRIRSRRRHCRRSARRGPRRRGRGRGS
jgi:hypothetical protein